ncbi:MAG: uracil-DNA glycosylase [Desulfosarcina sp.]|nr:uracil-DNA glycosylase [Desulfobacterales bacterium]
MRYLHEIGFKGFDCSKKSLNIITSWGQPVKRQPVKKQVTGLKKIEADMQNCSLCRLSASGGKFLFGTGNPDADLMLIGGMPSGPDNTSLDNNKPDDLFAGKAGELLEKIINAINLTKDDVYFCNIIKCSTPGERVPKQDEINTCAPFMEQQINAVKPLFICALGETAIEFFLKTGKPVSALRGRVYNYKGIKLLPTYHPADLLRDQSKKRDVWEDMKMLMRKMKRGSN